MPVVPIVAGVAGHAAGVDVHAVRDVLTVRSGGPIASVCPDIVSLQGPAVAGGRQEEDAGGFHGRP